jgi:2-methylisocitrate lyase-like PEP mutase family enzyme
MWFFITLMENTDLLLLFASSDFKHAQRAFRFAAAGFAALWIPSRALAASAGAQDLRIQAGSRSYVP